MVLWCGEERGEGVGEGEERGVGGGEGGQEAKCVVYSAGTLRILCTWMQKVCAREVRVCVY